MKPKASTHQQVQRKKRNLLKRNSLQRQRRARRGQVRTLFYSPGREGGSGEGDLSRRREKENGPIE